jgi:hypothetical protein
MPGARTQNFSWGAGGGGDPEAIYNLFDFKTVLQKLSPKNNITLSATVFIYTQI